MLRKGLVLILVVVLILPTQLAQAAPTVLTQAKTTEKVVALTFDDGWDNKTCELVRQILAEYGVLATIFPVGTWAASNSAVVQRFLADGHELANHSMTHPKLTMLSLAQQEKELREAHAVLAKIGGQQLTNFVRPPYGSYDKNTLQAAANLGLQPITWSIDSWDWRDIPVDQVVKRTLEAARPGGVILMHLAGRNTVKALPRIIEGLRNKGYTFVLLSQLFSQHGVVKQKPLEVYYQGEVLAMEPAARLVDGVTYVPCREFLRHFGWWVHWDSELQTAVCHSTTKQLMVKTQADDSSGGLMGLLLNGKLYVPLRAMAGELGLQVGWDSHNNRVTLR